ncbi:ATP-binding protein [Dictyobacter kobayashii]|uniref:Molecular chaperone HtpG n=1 Tax=Dictyobacter kobayashii TaxID=2014872 RepID=A0A402AYG1_9CHLR|nr:ATP-binding protein [Dictyobacter kobayashii]GCE24162.1 hypothetical protein KDK_79620 [Dictyobacter kobayashii]
MDEAQKTTRHRIKIDLQGLIRVLAKNLYAESDVFLREMVQNAHDSIKKRSSLDPHAPIGTIHIHINRMQRTITFTDNGSGLTEQEVHDYLSTIGRSGTNEFRQELITKGRQAEVTLIGQFGIGLLSAFVVAHRVEVETLSIQPGSSSWLWSSDGQSDYELVPGQRPEVGTTVKLFITDAYMDMLIPEELRKAIKKYADFIPYQIFLNDEKVPANAVNAPWHLNIPSEDERLKEYTSFVGKRFPNDSILETIPVALRTPYRVDGVLYISDRRDISPTAEGKLELYQNRMFVTSHESNILPPWAQFISGVIDSPDMTLTASRDAVQQDYITQEIREALATIVVQHLQNMAKKTPERFELIMLWHAFNIRNMALDHDDFFDAIADLMPFDTNRGRMNLRHYCAQALKLENNSGHDIFYFSDRENASRFYMLCDAKAMLVINAGQSFEEPFLKKYAQRHPEIRLHLISSEGTDFLFEPASTEEEQFFQPLMMDFYHIHPGQPLQMRLVHFKPRTIPAIANIESGAKLRQDLEENQQSVHLSQPIKDLLSRVLKEHKVPQVLLYLNTENPIMQKIAHMAATQRNNAISYRAAIAAIYNNALLLSPHLMTAETIQAIFTSATETINLMIEQAEQLGEMQSRLSASQLSLRTRPRQEMVSKDVQAAPTDTATPGKQILCVVAMPSEDTATLPYASVLLPALRHVMEFAPYYWRVVSAAELDQERGQQQPHIYLADLSTANLQVVMELGYMCGKKQDWQTILLLQSEQAHTELPHLDGLTRINYPADKTHYTVSTMVEALRPLLEQNEQIQHVNQLRQERYLSPLYLEEEFWIPGEVASEIARIYSSIEEFTSAPVEEITSRVRHLTSIKARRLQQSLQEVLEETHH